MRSMRRFKFRREFGETRKRKRKPRGSCQARRSTAQRNQPDNVLPLLQRVGQDAQGACCEWKGRRHRTYGRRNSKTPFRIPNSNKTERLVADSRDDGTRHPRRRHRKWSAPPSRRRHHLRRDSSHKRAEARKAPNGSRHQG